MLAYGGPPTLAEVPCGGPVIETEGPCRAYLETNLGEYDFCGRDKVDGTFHGELAFQHEYVAPLVHVEQDGPCQHLSERLDGELCGKTSYGTDGGVEIHEMMHEFTPRIIPDSEAGHAVKVER